MEKRGIWLILIVFVFGMLMLGLVFAQEGENSTEVEEAEEEEIDEETDDLFEDDFAVEGEIDGVGVDKAYRCLDDQIERKSENSLSFREAIFSTLALGSKSKLQNVIDGEKRSRSECWPGDGCTIKDTALVLLAYDRIGKSGGGIEEWLKSREENTKELTWYLQIDIQDHIESECSVRYDSQDRAITVREDMKLQGNGGSCLNVGYGGYWLKIDDDCLDKDFEVSCDQDFVTTLAYQRGTTGTVFVSSDTKSGSSLGTTDHQVSSKCFSAESECDYEGTLWSAVALKKTGNEVSAYLPFLLALADSNLEYFPSTFLYFLTGGEDQYSEVVQKQKPGGFWDVAGGENRFYDTSLAMFALGGSGSSEVGGSKSYLLDIQTSDGCWNNNNIRDTAFVLYSGWPRAVAGSGGGGGSATCQSQGYYCENSFKCSEVGGNLLVEFDCSASGVGLECCSVPVAEETCGERGGVTCSADESCDGRSVSSAEGSCCIGKCGERAEENTCEARGGDCRVSCFEGEKDNGDSCGNSGDVCCVESFENEEPSRGISIWIWILVGLIVLVIIGIIFRKKLQVWMWRRKGKAKVRGVPRPPRGPPGGVGARYGVPPRPRRVAQKPSPAKRGGSPKDKEMEETMKKLKEMSK